ncbi:phage head closure protein [Fictibacillus sp. JL2B1089]|uniref:phage head closure protein n=1 Tax=Fictibacillus sp. JL2B1089 TaxID=3399565 RepID=UPI003A85F634
MNPGRLNKRITLQRKGFTRDAESNTKESWLDTETVWAAVEPLRGREYLAAAAASAESLVRFRIRYRKNVTADMRVKYNDRIFELNSPPIDPEESHKELILMCKEVLING